MRFTGTAHEISYAATLEFFESRGRHAQPDRPQTATMYQDSDLAARRDACEKETVLPLLGLQGGERVLDLGCGYGRWGQTLVGRIGEYVGVDFSAELLRVAEGLHLPSSRFHRLPAQDVSAATLGETQPFDVFICSGILIYLNDADVDKLGRAISALAAPNARVYLREPMALAERLTLDRFPSAELKQDYSAIYRTPAQCRELFGGPLNAAGFKLVREKPLYPPELCNRQETEQQIQLWTRNA
jgi:cyclopropane fatty-acyl-phospholipid synthase-like methyltransferase